MSLQRTLYFDSHYDVLDEVRNLSDSGYSRVGNWTLGQMCNHLAEGIEMTLRTRVPDFVERPFVAIFLKLQFLGRIGDLLGLRIPTTLPQNEPIPDSSGIESLNASLLRLDSSKRAALMRFHLWHGQHHLSFLIPNTN